MAAVLELQGIVAGYGDTTVLEDVTLTMAAGESLSIVGRNGVGKTTLLETIAGHTTLRAGEIRLAGEAVHKLPAYARARRGVGYVPQEREIFPSLTVLENLTVASSRGRWTLDSVLDLFPGLQRRLHHTGEQLSGGEQQMLSIARALMTNPILLMMDEPSEGLAPIVVDQLFAAMKKLQADEGMAILLVEQKVDRALDFAQRAVVMDRGRIVADPDSAALRRDAGRLGSLVGVAGSA